MPGLETVPTVVTDNGRSASYAAHLQDMAQQGLCPLDIEVFRQIGGERIIHETEGDNGWVLAHNLEPYPNAETHLLFFPKRHITTPAEMTAQDRLTVWELLDYSCSELDVAFGGIFMRFSNQEGMHAAAGASIVHLHGQIVVPTINPETGRAPGWQPGSPTPDAHAVMVKIG